MQIFVVQDPYSCLVKQVHFGQSKFVTVKLNCQISRQSSFLQPSLPGMDPTPFLWTDGVEARLCSGSRRDPLSPAAQQLPKPPSPAVAVKARVQRMVGSVADRSADLFQSVLEVSRDGTFLRGLEGRRDCGGSSHLCPAAHLCPWAGQSCRYFAVSNI